MFTYENVVAQLSQTERAQYWDDMRLFGILLGLQPDAMPLSLADFWTYWHRMVAEELEPGSAARELAAFLVQSLTNLVPARLRSSWLERVAVAWTAGSAPRNWAYALDIDPDGQAARDFRRVSRVLRVLLRALPQDIRWIPAYHQARLRVAQARGTTPPRVSIAVERLNTRWPLPLSIQPLKALDADERRVLVELFDA